MREKKAQPITKTETTEINALPRLKLFDAKQGARQRIEALSSFVQYYFSENSDVINVLEAGCGRYWNLDMGDVKYKLTGVDINISSLKLRISNKRDLDRAIVGDLSNVELNREKFDMVYCVNVIEHIKGAEQVITKFFSWLKPEGLLILVFPNRDSVFGLLTRALPLWVHLLIYKFVFGNPNAGKPGYGPFPTYYDIIVSRRAIHDYCYKCGHSIVLEYGRPYNFLELGWLGTGARILFKLIQWLSFGKLAADHSGLAYIIKKHKVGLRQFA